jgi:phenylacetate-CoA ligase
MAENPAAKKQASLIRGILSISERTYPHQNELFNSIFTNAKVVSFYGLSEKVAFATIDPDDSMTYHFSPIYGVTELLDDNFKPIVEPGKIGQLYSTGLLFTGTRFIRYELGDQAELVELPSRLNNYVLSVRNLESRWTARPAVGKNGELIHITSLNLHEPVMNYFSQMQFLQEKPGHLQISIIPNQKSSSKNLEDLRLMMQNLVGESLEVTVKTVGSLERNSRGKSPLLVVKSS